MPLGIVNDDVFDKEVNSIPIGEVVLPTPRGRGDNVETPDSIRKIIGDNALTEGRADTLDLAAAFGISSSSVSAYTNGATSTKTYDKDNPLKGFLANRKKNIAGRASVAILRAIENISDEKLASSKAIELASVAKSLSGVVKDMIPEKIETPGANNNSGVQFLIYAPQQSKEESFDVIDV